MNRSGKEKSINLSVIKKAIVVDGDPSMLSLVDNYLKHAKVGDVQKCSNGVDALPHITGSACDLLVLDWKLKKPSGIEVYNQVRANASLAKLPILLISGSVTAADLQIAKVDPYAKFIVKPFTEEVIISYISKFFKSLENDQSVDKSSKPSSSVRSDSKDSGLTIVAGGKENGLGLQIDHNTRLGKSESQVMPSNSGESKGPTVFESDHPSTFSATEEKSNDAEMMFTQSSRSTDGTDIKIKGSADSGTDFSFTQTSNGQSKPSSVIVEASAQPQNGASSSNQNKKKSNASMMLDEDSEPASESPSEVVSQRIGADGSKILCSANVLGTQTEIAVPKKVVVVDQDSAQQILITQYLNELGIDNVVCFDDSKTAWEHILSGGVELIVLDWKLKGLHGLGLYSRIRENSKTARIPMIVTSGLAHKGDFRILGESNYTTFLEKPIKKKPFDEAVKETFINAATHDKISSMVRGLIDKVQHDYSLTMRTIEGMLKNIAKPFLFVLSAGQRLFELLHLEVAEKVLKIAQHLDPDNVTVATELSKIYLRTGRCELAKKLISKASIISPESVERLCLMGEVGLTMSDTVTARRAFEEVFKIDKEHPKAIAGMTLVNGMIENKDNKTLPESYESNGKSVAQALASSLNAVAVMYVRNAQIDKAIAQYQAALCFIYDSPTIARLQFNLGLAHLKAKNYKESQACFLTASKLASRDFQRPKIISEKLAKIFGESNEVVQLSVQQLADCVELTKEVESEPLAEFIKVDEEFQILPFS